MTGLLIRGARPVRFRSRSDLGRLRAAGAAARAELGAPPAPGEPVDLRINDGAVVEMGTGLARHDGEEVLDAGGAFLIPGLWDAHAHLDLEAARVARLDLGRTACVEDALEIVAAEAQRLRSATGAGAARGPALIQGFGHRLSHWPRVPSVTELDAVTGPIPTVLVSGDAHSGWVNSACLPRPTPTPVLPSPRASGSPPSTASTTSPARASSSSPATAGPWRIWPLAASPASPI